MYQDHHRAPRAEGLIHNFTVSQYFTKVDATGAYSEPSQKRVLNIDDIQQPIWLIQISAFAIQIGLQPGCIPVHMVQILEWYKDTYFTDDVPMYCCTKKSMMLVYATWWKSQVANILLFKIDRITVKHHLWHSSDASMMLTECNTDWVTVVKCSKQAY